VLKKLVLMSLLTAAILVANSPETAPTERTIPPWQHLWDGLRPRDPGRSHDASSDFRKGEPNRTSGEADDPGRQQPAPDWGDDVLVAEVSYENSGRISVDNDDRTGDIYVCMLHQDASEEDTAHIFRSTDGGRTWHQHTNIHSTSTVGNMLDAQIVCAHGPGDTTWLCAAVAQDKAGLMFRRTTPDSSAFYWVRIDTTTSAVRVALDRNTENPEHLFVVWTEADGDIRAMSSTNAGATWGNASYVTSRRRDGSFAAGGDGYGYVAYMDADESTYVRVGRFDNNLVSPHWEFHTVDSVPDHRFREVAIAADRTAPGGSQVAVVLATSRVTSTNNIYPRYAWTLNGGVSWSSSFWPVTDQPRATWDVRMPRIRRSYDDTAIRAIVSMRETTTTWDTIVYAYTLSSDPTNWLGRGVYNDHRNTGEVSHDVGSSSTAQGGFIAYREFGTGKVWFDGYDFTGVTAAPAPTRPRRMATVFAGGVKLFLPRRSQVNAAVYNQEGRLVRVLFNGTVEAGQHRLDPGVGRGVFFLRVAVNGKAETAKLVTLQ
jgi:hypothetical protein